MATSGRGTGVVGYNVQVAVDTEHHLIVTHEVTNTGSDRSQLANVALQAKHVLGADHLDVVADRGYFNSTEILACEQADITVTLPKPMTSGAKSEGRFGKQDFVYLPTEDVYHPLESAAFPRPQHRNLVQVISMTYRKQSAIVSRSVSNFGGLRPGRRAACMATARHHRPRYHRLAYGPLSWSATGLSRPPPSSAECPMRTAPSGGTGRAGRHIWDKCRSQPRQILPSAAEIEADGGAGCRDNLGHDRLSCLNGLGDRENAAADALRASK
jgi:hypothetical protein